MGSGGLQVLHRFAYDELRRRRPPLRRLQVHRGPVHLRLARPEEVRLDVIQDLELVRGLHARVQPGPEGRPFLLQLPAQGDLCDQILSIAQY